MLALIILFLLSKTQHYSKRKSKTIKTLSKGFERSVYWNEYKTKSENKNTTNEYRYFLASSFVGADRLFVFVYTNQNDFAKKILNLKRLFTERKY